MTRSAEAAGFVARIDRLERRNRQLSWALFGLLALALLPAAALAVPRGVVVEANRFVLKDSEGAKRGEFLIGPEGNGRIVLYGEDGRPVATLPMEGQIVPLRQ